MVNSTACASVYASLYNSGVLNEILARQIQLDLYKKIAHSYFGEFIQTATQTQLETILNCNQGWAPNNALPFFQAYEGTCMALCYIQGYDVFQPDIGGGGNNPFGLALLPYPVTYYWVHVSYKKCTNTCCKVYIDYCWDSANQTWKRRTNIGSVYGPDQCPSTTESVETCTAPPRLLLRVTQVVNTNFGPCEHTCTSSTNTENVTFE